MNLKKLTQAVFEGLPSEYRWAVTDFCGEVFALSGEKPELNAQKNDWHFCGKDYLLILCKYGDTNDWQNSLIKRQDVPTAVQSSFESQLNEKRNFAELHDKPFTPCRASAPTAADIDWSKAPEWAQAAVMNANGAWNWVENASCFAELPNNGWREYGMFEAIENADISSEKSKWPESKLLRPGSITDVARSIEAARVAEQAERTYPHYFKDVSAVDAIDLYHVARLYDITDPALFHAFKKIACAGKRGAKDQAQDVQEAIDAMKRWQELNV